LKRHLLLVPCLLILSAVALSACGGGGGSSDEGEIEEAIETTATTSDPANCTELQTQKFDEQNSQTEGAAAVKACEKEGEEGEEVAESAEVSNVSVNGEKASAEVAFTGGSFNGQAVELDLVNDGGSWKLDEVVAFTNYDPQKLEEAFEGSFESQGGISKQMTACIAEAFGGASKAQAEELIFGGSQKPLEELIVTCR
jgi:hypothetical protein